MKTLYRELADMLAEVILESTHIGITLSDECDVLVECTTAEQYTSLHIPVAVLATYDTLTPHEREQVILGYRNAYKNYLTGEALPIVLTVAI